MTWENCTRSKSEVWKYHHIPTVVTVILHWVSCRIITKTLSLTQVVAVPHTWHEPRCWRGGPAEHYFTCHPAEQMAPSLVGLPSCNTLDSQAWRISSPLERKPIRMSVSLQAIIFSEIWKRECWWFSSAFWLPPYAGPGPDEAKVNEAHPRRECLETSAQICAHCPVELTSFRLWSWSQKWSTNAAFQQVKCSCSSGSGKSLQFDLR